MPPVPGPPTDGDAIACIREQRLMTRAELAAQVGRTPQWITNIENGYVNAPAAMLTLIAAALGVPESRITYKGSLPLADRARTPGAQRFALAQQSRSRRGTAPREAGAGHQAQDDRPVQHQAPAA
jgi:transcriptional regulator with XRE-family HTH domain